jgi:hypothetical protein
MKRAPSGAVTASSSSTSSRHRDGRAPPAYAVAVRAPTKPVLVYPEADDMGKHELQRLIAELLRPKGQKGQKQPTSRKRRT